MIKAIFTYIILFSSVLFDYVFNEQVNVYAKFPAETIPGTTIQIEITIEKGELSEFGRFVQELPQGFTASSDDNNFMFEEQKVKFIWVSLPYGSQMKFSYNVTIPADYQGNFQVTGIFDYVAGSEKKSVELKPQTITLKPTGTNPESLKKDFSYASNSDQLTPPERQISCTRGISQLENYSVVSIKINKGDLTSMAKISDNIPQGYIAESIDVKGGIFTVENNTVKILWMNAPAENEFTVTYKVSSPNTNDFSDFKVTGDFSYNDNGVTKSIGITEQSKDTQTLTTQPIEKSVQKNTEKAITKSNIEDNTNSVIYRVQIAAGHRMVNLNNYFRKYKISEKVIADQHKGWHKYMIGSFRDYKSARDYRTKIWDETSIDDAFVTAYNKGARITVQEALMVTSNKWFQ